MPSDLGENIVFAPHFYDPIVTISHSWDNDTKRLEDAADDLAAEANRLHSALWIGEWNVWENSVENGEAYLVAQLRIFDERAASWSFWEYNLDWPDCPFTPGSPNTWIAEALERPYPQRAAGTIEHLSFDTENGFFKLELQNVRGVIAPSEIYLPAHVYGENFTVRVRGASLWQFDQKKRVLIVDAPSEGNKQTVEVSP